MKLEKKWQFLLYDAVKLKTQLCFLCFWKQVGTSFCRMCSNRWREWRGNKVTHKAQAHSTLLNANNLFFLTYLLIIIINKQVSTKFKNFFRKL
ncbi:hypothetical protein Patl1_24167 [Pistacia atlantica]|uniref:Uncharacterized protein n=1 Tax=Pistacia atlantica TaxID=434234 RepID=A0ACC0ZZX0_9ROSI|nr:hypothetical protein Patl1_24167 [Pistacia atlantica]